jgi:carboxyl-terminal processing protease
MLGRLKRSHFVLLSGALNDGPSPAGEATLGVDLRVLDSDIVITHVAEGSKAEKAGLAQGQVLLAVDDYSAASWWRPSVSGADPRAVSLAVWQRAQRSLRGAPGSHAAVRVRDAHGERVLQVERVLEPGDRVVLGDVPPFMTRVTTESVETPRGRAVGVIGFNVWMTSVSDPIARAIDRFRSAKGIVIDLRGNPGGLATMINGVAGHLFATPDLLGRMKTRTSDLEFHANPRLVTPDGVRVEPFKGPVALLVDELTGSASECFAGALQSVGRARVFGRQTLGQALPASTRRLTNGDVLMYVVGDFVTATGRRLEGEGVRPDEVVPLSLAVLRTGRDATLEAALRWIDSPSSFD